MRSIDCLVVCELLLVPEEIGMPWNVNQCTASFTEKASLWEKNMLNDTVNLPSCGPTL